MKAILFLGSLAALTLATACSTHRVNMRTNRPGGKIVEQRLNYFVGGLFGGEDLHLEKICPTGVSGITTRHSPVDGFLTGLTGMLYSPITVEVQCADGRAQLFGTSAEHASELLASLK